MQQFSVVHIASFVNGGAGTSAYRIHKALLDAGVQSVFICSDQPDAVKQQQAVTVAKPRYSFFERGVNKIKRLSGSYFHLKGFNSKEYFEQQLAKVKNQMVCEVASLPFSVHNLAHHPAVINADIIHLHWVAGFIDYPSFFSKINKPIVWTFHDMNPFMGLFHYRNDEVQNEKLTNKLNNRVKQIKKHALAKAGKGIAYVCPSEWLYNEACNSGWFGKEKLQQIGYTLNADVFCIKDKNSLRNEFGIPVTHTVFLFVSQTVTNYRKGFHLLAGALSQIEPAGITLLIIGKQQAGLAKTGFNCIYTGFINDELLLSKYYAMADAFVLPSREDNLPNVMLEALHCGVPIICFNVGGMASVIIDGEIGIKAADVNVSDLCKALKKFLETKGQFNASVIRQKALEQFSAHNITQKYWTLYWKLLNDNPVS